MMLPAVFSRWGIAACARKNGPVRFTPRIRLQSSSLTEGTSWKRSTPATFPSTSSLPNAAMAASTAARHCAGLVMSKRVVRILPPADDTSFSVSASAASLTSTPNTAAPSDAKRWQAARPMPDAAPVIRTTFPSNRFMLCSYLCDEPVSMTCFCDERPDGPGCSRRGISPGSTPTCA